MTEEIKDPRWKELIAVLRDIHKELKAMRTELERKV